MAQHNGTWFDVCHGVLAIRVWDEIGEPMVYPLVGPASGYYRGMTEWMPCLLRQRI